MLGDLREMLRRRGGAFWVVSGWSGVIWGGETLSLGGKLMRGAIICIGGRYRRE